MLILTKRWYFVNFLIYLFHLEKSLLKNFHSVIWYNMSYGYDLNYPFYRIFLMKQHIIPNNLLLNYFNTFKVFSSISIVHGRLIMDDVELSAGIETDYSRCHAHTDTRCSEMGVIRGMRYLFHLYIWHSKS